MKKLVRKDDPRGVHYTKSESTEGYYWLGNGGKKDFLPLRMKHENNRGWTFENCQLGSGCTKIFCSRGEWEMVEA